MTENIKDNSPGVGQEWREVKKELLEKIEGLAREAGETKTAISALSAYRYDQPTEPENYLQEPGICLIAQGAKRVMLRHEVIQNDPDNYLLTLLDMPVVTEIVEASREKPYYALSLKLDLQVISQMILDQNMPAPSRDGSGGAIGAGGLDLSLLKAFIRLLDLQNEPENIPMLAPLVKKEIIYRLLIGPRGHQLRQLTLSGSQSNRIVQTIEWLKKNYTKHLRIEELASHSRMSASTFHHHFRQLTSMTPLQYQKWLRLQEARRLMLAEKMDAANAAFSVGYESPSQFSREYSRMYNAPPSQDIKQLREGIILT